MSFNDISLSGRAGLAQRIAQLRARFAATRHRRAVYLRTHAELQALSDRDLGDLGFHRSEIGRVAREAARKA